MSTLTGGVIPYDPAQHSDKCACYLLQKATLSRIDQVSMSDLLKTKCPSSRIMECDSKNSNHCQPASHNAVNNEYYLSLHEYIHAKKDSIVFMQRKIVFIIMCL